MRDERTEELEAPDLVLGAFYFGGLLLLIGWLAS